MVAYESSRRVASSRVEWHLLSFLDIFRPGLGILPTMEGHDTLNMLMNSLFANNELRNWSIFEEKNGAIVVKLRFENSVTNSENNSRNHVSFKRKSESQMQRDRNRAARRRNTYMASATSVQDGSSTELPRHSERNSISDTTPLDFSPVQLSLSATSFTPDTRSVKRDSEQQIQGLSTKLNSSFVSMSSLDINSLTCEEVSSAIETHSDNEFANVDSDAAVSFPPVPDEISRAGYYNDSVDSYKCLDEACSYGPKDLVGVCFVNISICHKCKNVYICDECLSKGRHQRHSPFIKPSIPFLT